MKRFSGLMMASCLVLLTGTAFGAETIKIGVAGAHSGDLASYGMPTANAARLVTKEVNAKGGIDGKQIELLIQDEECKPEKATNVATKLISDGAVAVLGHICSGPTKAALPIYTAAKLVSISPTATSPELTRSGQYPLFFRTIAADDAQANLGADFAVNKLNAKKIALLHDKGDYGRGYAEFARDFIKNSGKAEVVLFEGVTPGAMDYSRGDRTCATRSLSWRGAGWARSPWRTTVTWSTQTAFRRPCRTRGCSSRPRRTRSPSCTSSARTGTAAGSRRVSATR